MRMVLWHVGHPVQHFVGRAYRLYGAGAQRKEAAWRYPVTWTAHALWSRWHAA